MDFEKIFTQSSAAMASVLAVKQKTTLYYIPMAPLFTILRQENFPQLFNR